MLWNTDVCKILTDRVKNDALQQVNEQRTMVDTVKARKLQRLGHTFRHDSPLRVLEGIIPGEEQKRRANRISQICGEPILKYVDINTMGTTRIKIREC